MDEGDHREETQDQKRAADQGLLGPRQAARDPVPLRPHRGLRGSLAHDGSAERCSAREGRHYKALSAMPASPSRAALTVGIEEEAAKATLRAQRERSARPPPKREGYTRDFRTSVPHSRHPVSKLQSLPQGEALPFSTSAGTRRRARDKKPVHPFSRSSPSFFTISDPQVFSCLKMGPRKPSEGSLGSHPGADRGQHLLPNPDLKATVTVLFSQQTCGRLSTPTGAQELQCTPPPRAGTTVGRAHREDRS